MVQSSQANPEDRARARGRALRIVQGLLNPETRPRYASQLRRLLRGEVSAVVVPSNQHGHRCLVCHSRKIATKKVTPARGQQKSFAVRHCRVCGYIANPDNSDSGLDDSVPQFAIGRRIGTLERPGREYHMAELGAAILEVPNLDVLVYKPGRSKDFVHVAELESIREVAVGDERNMHDTEDFVDIGKRATKRFPLVIASEVIECFEDPREDFARLFSFVAKDGLLICSTNIYDGGPLSRHNYLFIKGHVSYYTPLAIERIAKDYGFLFDFRMPISATTYAGPRKRYVFFTRNVEQISRIARYFGDHCYAPSEL